MLQPDGDGALSVEDAMKYAKENNIPMLTGKDILEVFGLN
jgi:3,4-dihydroxy-2-butanone 4-phosphate synthase